MGLRTPTVTTAASAVTLGATYANIGDVISIEGLGELALHLKSTGTGNAVVKVYVDPDAAAAPANADAAGMHQLGAAAGTEIEYTCLTGELIVIPLSGVSGKWLALKGKYSATDGVLTHAKVTGNSETGSGEW